MTCSTLFVITCGWQNRKKNGNHPNKTWDGWLRQEHTLLGQCACLSQSDICICYQYTWIQVAKTCKATQHICHQRLSCTESTQSAKKCENCKRTFAQNYCKGCLSAPTTIQLSRSTPQRHTTTVEDTCRKLVWHVSLTKACCLAKNKIAAFDSMARAASRKATRPLVPAKTYTILLRAGRKTTPPGQESPIILSNWKWYTVKVPIVNPPPPQDFFVFFGGGSFFWW